MAFPGRDRLGVAVGSIGAILALVAAVWVFQKLADTSVLVSGPLDPSIVAKSGQELVLRGFPEIKPNQAVLQYGGERRQPEKIQLYFERARIAPALMGQVASLKDAAPLPAGENKIRVRIESSGKSAESSRPDSRVFITVKALDGMDGSDEILLRVTPDRDNALHLLFEMQASRPLRARIEVNSPPPRSEENGSLPPPYELRVGVEKAEWPALLPLEIDIPSGQPIAFSVIPDPEQKGKPEPFSGFDLLPPPDDDKGAFAARAVGVRYAGAQSDQRDVWLSFLCGAPPKERLLSGECPLDRDAVPKNSLLQFRHLEIGRAQLQLDVLGTGWVTAREKPSEINALDWMLKNPLLALLFGSLGGALVSWVTKIVLRKNPAESAPPKNSD